MIISLDKLLSYSGNRYIFTKSAMQAVEKLGNIKSYPERDKNWKVVPNLLQLMLDEKIKYDVESIETEKTE